MPNLIRPVDNRVSQVFGARPSYYSQFGLLGHEGIDYASPVGTPTKAAASGVVHFVGSHKNYGTYIKIAHADGTTTAYAHLSSVNVKSSQQVPKGYIIGRTGNTGNVQGAHLHFMLLTSNTRNGYGGAINPEPYFKPIAILRRKGQEQDMNITNHEQVDVLYQAALGRRAETVKAKENWMGKDIFKLVWSLIGSSEYQQRNDIVGRAYPEALKKIKEIEASGGVKPTKLNPGIYQVEGK